MSDVETTEDEALEYDPWQGEAPVGDYEPTDEEDDTSYVGNATFQQRVTKHRVLSKREEQKLIARAQQGDKRARDEFLMLNVKLVYSRVNKVGFDLPEEDRFSEGMLGMMHALDLFDLTKINPKSGQPYAFSTYAVSWIDQYIRRAEQNQSRVVRPPVHVQERHVKVRNLDRDLSVALGRVPSVAELAEALGKSEDWILDHRLLKRADSLDQSVSEEIDSTLHDIIEDQHAPSAHEIITRAESAKRIAQAIEDICTPRQARVLYLHLGLAGNEPQTLQDIADQMGCTRERVRQLQDEGLERLSAHLDRWYS